MINKTEYSRNNTPQSIQENEYTLKDKQLLLKNIIHTIPNTVWLKDTQGIYLVCNHEVEKVFGACEKDIIGKSDYDFLSKEQAESFRKQDRNVITNNKLLINEEWITYADNSKIVLQEILKTPLRNSKNEVIGVLGIAHDVTDREKLNKKLLHSERLTSMEEIINNIAHQWRQPLSVISMGITGMQVQKEMGYLTDELFFKTCTLINKNAQYLSQTIEELKNYIKESNNRVIFNFEDNMNEFLSCINESAISDNINIVYENTNTSKINISGCESKLIQCYLSIFNNSRDAFKENNINEKYFYIKILKEKNCIKITLLDNAGGIPENILPKIFEPYATTKHKFEGRGLSLYKAYKLISEGMGGVIEVNNVSYFIDQKEHQGAEFIITIPLS